VSDWSALQPQLESIIRNDPTGKIAIKAARAACRVEVQVSASFGLISHPPSITTAYMIDETVPASKGMFCLQEIDLRWDMGPWQPIAWGSTDKYRYEPEEDPGFWSITASNSLAGIAKAAELREGPHRLEIRLTTSILDSHGVPVFDSGILTYAAPDGLKNLVPKARDTKIVVNASLSLFHDYPEDFPQLVPVGSLERPLESWFRVQRLRVVQAERRKRPEIL